MIPTPRQQLVKQQNMNGTSSRFQLSAFAVLMSRALNWAKARSRFFVSTTVLPRYNDRPVQIRHTSLHAFSTFRAISFNRVWNPAKLHAKAVKQLHCFKIAHRQRQQEVARSQALEAILRQVCGVSSAYLVYLPDASRLRSLCVDRSYQNLGLRRSERTSRTSHTY